MSIKQDIRKLEGQRKRLARSITKIEIRIGQLQGRLAVTARKDKLK